MAGESAREEARRAREKATRLARRAEMFEKGAAGEVATASILQGLPPEWIALHDLRWPSRRLANIDHVVVGPGGVFVIDSKNWSGSISLRDGALQQNGRSREKEVARCADAALAVAELAGPFAQHVHPVMCFHTHAALTGWSRDVMICSTTTLTTMLRTRPVVLTDVEVRDAHLRLDVSLRAATDPPPNLPPRTRPDVGRTRMTQPTARPSARPLRRRKRQNAAMRHLMASVALLVGFAVYGPELLASLGGGLADRLVDAVTDCRDGGQRSSDTGC